MSVMFSCARSGLGLSFLSSLLFGSACSLVVDAGREQCSDDQDCEGFGEASLGSICVAAFCEPRPDPNWACLDSDIAAAPAPATVRMLVPLLDLVSGEPRPGVDLRACARLDADCTMPMASGVSDARGEVDLRVPGGFDGYLRWEATGVYPTLFFIGAPVVQDTIFPVTPISPQVFEGLNAQFQGETIPGRSAVVVYVKNCAGVPSPGVEVTIPEGDAATRAYYFVDGLFPPSQTESSPAGIVRVINVPQGNVSVVGTLPDGRKVSTTVLTRDGFATLTNLVP